MTMAIETDPYRYSTEATATTVMAEVVKPLSPHEAEPKVEIIGGEENIPTILLSLNAYRDTFFISEASDGDEVGWLGTVQQLDNNCYLIDRLFLFNQEVSGAHCEFNRGDIGKFYTEMVKNPATKAMVNSIMFWGHLHPGDMTEPSSQDEDQMELFSHNPFFIRGIFTRGGKCVFTFFDYQHNIKITDCPWQLHMGDDTRREDIAKEVEIKVKKGEFTYKTKKTTTYAKGVAYAKGGRRGAKG